MELWIRSQDKESLIKVNNIYILCNCPEMPSADGYSLYNYNKLKENWFGDFLGKYKTKERALEVLDEIQSILCFKRLENYFGEGIINIENNTALYLMPKE